MPGCHPSTTSTACPTACAAAGRVACAGKRGRRAGAAGGGERGAFRSSDRSGANASETVRDASPLPPILPPPPDLCSETRLRRAPPKHACCSRPVHGGRSRRKSVQSRRHARACVRTVAICSVAPARAAPLGARTRGGAAACLAGPARSLLAAVGHADASPPSHVSETLAGVCLDLMGRFSVDGR